MNHDWLHVVANAHHASADSVAERGVIVQRVLGGANNAMYRVCVDDKDYAVKLCVVDERRRAWREYAALELFERLSLDIAPKPVLLDESSSLFPYPIVAYRWVNGEPLNSVVTQDQLVALVRSIQQTHSIRPDDVKDTNLLDATFHHFDLNWYLSELQEFFSKYAEWLSARVEDQGTHARLKRLVESCIRRVSRAQVDVSRSCIPLRFCHVDSNLANVIWDHSHHLRWVDWEYSGWGDPALELSEFQWHMGVDALTERQRRWLRENYRRPVNDGDFEKRLAVWDRILVTRWTLLTARWLWSAYYGPDRERLTMPKEDPDDIRARLVRAIERAEQFVS